MRMERWWLPSWGWRVGCAKKIRDLRTRAFTLVGCAKRCVHIGDRESDIYELFSLADELGTRFLVRTCVDRLAGDGDHTIADEMADVRVQGLHASSSATSEDSPVKPPSSSDIGASRSCRPSASRSCIRRWN
jgi:hypothetical protein